MRSLVISAGVFICLLLGAFLGMTVRRKLPGHHVNTDSKDAVKIGMALIATMAALVLSLLIASTKASFDAQNSEVRQMAADLVMLDRLLGAYGPEAGEPRTMLRDTVREVVEGTWERGGSRVAIFGNPKITSAALAILTKIEALPAADTPHETIRAQAAELIKSSGHTRWQLVAQDDSSIQTPFLAVLVFWLVILFASFGLFAPPNATVFIAFGVCAVSVAGALFLILELDRPFQGLMHISSEPFRQVIE
jgi:hypothetical protein